LDFVPKANKIHTTTMSNHNHNNDFLDAETLIVPDDDSRDYYEDDEDSSDCMDSPTLKGKTPPLAVPRDVEGYSFLRDQQWMTSFQLLVQYKERMGHVNVPARHMEDGCKLGMWVSTQRRRRKKRIIPDHHVALLDDVGFLWNPEKGRKQMNHTSLRRIQVKSKHESSDLSRKRQVSSSRFQVINNDSQFELRMMIPDCFTMNDLTVTIQEHGRVLVIQGRCHEKDENDNCQFTSEFSQRIQIDPHMVDSDTLNARFKEGMLIVTSPKARKKRSGPIRVVPITCSDEKRTSVVQKSKAPTTFKRKAILVDKVMQMEHV
jgi:HSP20 family molecular chaperone IbpA